MARADEPGPCFNEKTYLERNPDVARAIAAGKFASARAHFETYGRREGRIGCPDEGLAGTGTGAPGRCFNEKSYLRRYPDVADAVAAGRFASGRDHFEKYGRSEGRIPCLAEDLFPIPQWVRVVLLGLALAAVGYASLRRHWSAPGTAIGLAVVMSLSTYLDYVLPLKAFIFRDIASDTVAQFWPMMTHLAERLRTGELPMWSFAVGLGQNVYPSWLSDPFALVAMLSGKTLLPNLLGPMQVAKIVVAVAFVAAYLQLRGHSRTAVIIGALSFGFCGHMVARGTWYEYGTEVPIIAFYLFALERFAQSGKFVLLAIATGFLGSMQAYFAYLYGLVFTVFALVRILYLRDRMFSTAWAVLGRFVAASLAGIGLSAVFLLPDLLTTLGSTRVFGDGQGPQGPGHGHSVSVTLRLSPLTTEGANVLTTAMARALSPNMLGNAGHFSGFHNYLEAPLPYAGLLALVCAIPALVVASRRQRIVVAAFLVAAIAYHYLVFFRVILNGFAGMEYFKISGFWIPMGLVLCLASTIDAIDRLGRAPRRAVVISMAVLIAVVGAVCVLSQRYGFTVHQRIAWTCLALILAYGVTLLANGAAWRGVTRNRVLVALVVAELAGTAAHSMDGRAAVDGLAPFKDSRYADRGGDVIARIRAGDPSQYRIERDSYSVYLADPLMQGYFGTSSYMSFSSPAYVRFLNAMGLLKDSFAAESYIGSIAGRPLLMPLLGVRYFMAHTLPAPPGYALRLDAGDLRVFSSRRATSIGYFFPRGATEAEIVALAPAERQVALLHAATLSEPPRLARRLSREELAAAIAAALPECRESWSCFREVALDGPLSSLGDRAVRVTHFEQNRIRASFSCSEPGILFFSIPFDAGWRMHVDGRSVQAEKVDFGFLGAEVAPGDHVVDLRYRTPGLLPGAIVAAFSACALVAAALLARRRRQS